MTAHLFQNTVDEYRKRWDAMAVPAATKGLADQVAKRLHAHADRYNVVSRATGVPPAVLMCIHEREASGRFDTYLGNGDPLNQATVHVPKGRGPFSTWEAGAVDALRVNHLDAVNGWTIERAAYEFELYNGFGYRNKGVPSAYLWAGSNQYVSGKYIKDGVWDAAAVDHQLGAMVLLKSLFDLDPALMLRRDVGGLSEAQPVPKEPIRPLPTPLPPVTAPAASPGHSTPSVVGAVGGAGLMGWLVDQSGGAHAWMWALGVFALVIVAIEIFTRNRKGN